MMTKVMTCSCPNKQQDAIHGPGLRVHNYAVGKSKPPVKVFRCTVCSTLRS